MKQEFSTKRLKKTALFCRFFCGTIFVRAILLNGSLAQGSAKESSDIDLLIIAQSHRLYTARFFLIILGFLTGQKRSKNENKGHTGKFCFNYFLADDFLKIPTGRGKVMDQYCADNYKNSVLVWGDGDIFARFLETNGALFRQNTLIISDNYKKELNGYFPINHIKIFQLAKKAFEKLLSGTFGDRLEVKLKNIQIKQIERDERTKKYPDLIVYNDQEARFHPPKHSNKLVSR